MTDANLFLNHADSRELADVVATQEKAQRDLVDRLRARIAAIEATTKELVGLRDDLRRAERALAAMSTGKKRVRAAKGEAASVVKFTLEDTRLHGRRIDYAGLLRESDIRSKELDRPPSLSALRREVRKALAAPTASAPR